VPFYVPPRQLSREASSAHPMLQQPSVSVLAQMRIAQCHLELLMPDDLLHFFQRSTVHDHMACSGMTKIMKAEVLSLPFVTTVSKAVRILPQKNPSRFLDTFPRPFAPTSTVLQQQPYLGVRRGAPVLRLVQRHPGTETKIRT
jgi:hypothetical protein